MISVVLTTYNRLEFLKKAIASVEAQTFTDWELVIVNDGSTDGTRAYLDELKNPKIRPIHRSKSFRCDTRPKNRGTKESKGEFIAYMDDDVEYRPDHLQALYSAITKSKVDVVYGDRMIIDLEKRMPDTVGVRSDFNPFLLLLRNFIDTSDVLVRREALFEVGGWDERYRKYVDWNLWVRMAKAGKKFQRVPLIITNYYLHNSQKSATVFTKNDNPAKQQFMPEWSAHDVEIDLPYLHTPKEIKVAVFSLTKDRLSYTKDCFNSLYAKAGYKFDHFIVDNGSTDGTAEYLQAEMVRNPRIKFVDLQKKNIGISKASNIALKQIMTGGYDIVIKYDNDCLSRTDGWVSTMVDLFKRNRMLCLSPYPEGLKDSPGGTPRIEYGRFDGYMVGLTTHLGGFCHVAPRSVYEQFRWREDQPLHGLQDLELSQWLTKNGYQMAYVEDLKVEHYRGTVKQHEDFPEYFKLREYEKTHTE